MHLRVTTQFHAQNATLTDSNKPCPYNGRLPSLPNCYLSVFSGLLQGEFRNLVTLPFTNRQLSTVTSASYMFLCNAFLCDALEYSTDTGILQAL